tara:strand:+ start:23 stop:553 length:531 start_codon:yes stop_codon:yes gene_type:complete
MKAEDCVLENVTQHLDLWKHGDPVRPELGVKFKTAPGRVVYGLKLTAENKYVAFCCVSRTTHVPKDVMELSGFTSNSGEILVPYTVWSLEKGAGRTIIKMLLDMVSKNNLADRVVTLSPRTEMARRFHLRNGATEISTNVASANFEYPVVRTQDIGDWYQSTATQDWDCASHGEST